MKKFMLVLCTSALLSSSLSFYAQERTGDGKKIKADKFKAEGLTQAVPVPENKSYAVKITFPEDDFYMLFDPPQIASYVTPEGIGCSNEWAETRSHEDEGDDYGEVGFDRNAVMWIESQNPARKVVRFRGALVDHDGNVQHAYIDSKSPYGEGDWADEWFYIYPDGVSVRVVKIYTGKAMDAVAFWGKPGYSSFWGVRGTIFETQETFIHGVAGKQPRDLIDTVALTLIRMDSQTKHIPFFPYPPDQSLFDTANIQMVNLKSRYHPFTIVTEGRVEIKPYYMPMEDHENLDSTVFITWPRTGHYTDGDYTSALSHVINWDWHEQTNNSLVQIYLLGMTEEPTEQERIAELVKLAKSWEYAPELVLTSSGYQYQGYEIKEKAYHFSKTSRQRDLEFVIKAHTDEPLVNPVFIIGGMSKKILELEINDRKISNYRSGFENGNMILWIPYTTTTETSFKISF